MEEALMDALLSASETLAEGLHEGLLAEGKSTRWEIRIEGSKAIIGSTDPGLARSEVGSAGSPPTGLVSRSARRAFPLVIAALHRKLVDAP